MLDGITTRMFADGTDLDEILGLADDPRISGFTTNPALMWRAGLTDYADSPSACSSTSIRIPSTSRCSAMATTRSAASRG